jgi:alkanesulfonate monooxygenase SsuD/methylene tetrahydromethanopterin reductase-like flavin-dependent oxidoreductase (luciferase family)
VRRDLSHFDWYAFVFVHVDRDGARARHEAARMMGGTYDQDFGPLVDSVAAAGTPDEVLGKIEQFIEAGARHFIFLPATNGTADYETTVGYLTEVLIPDLRSRTPPESTVEASAERAGFSAETTTTRVP